MLQAGPKRPGRHDSIELVGRIYVAFRKYENSVSKRLPRSDNHGAFIENRLFSDRYFGCHVTTQQPDRQFSEPPNAFEAVASLIFCVVPQLA